MKINLPLLTLDSVYSTKSSGPSKQLKNNPTVEHNIDKNPNWPEADQTSWLFTSVAEGLNSRIS